MNNLPSDVTAASGIHVYTSSALGLVVCAKEHNRVMGELYRENAKLRENADRLASFARGYRSHQHRNPADELDSTLAEYEALRRRE